MPPKKDQKPAADDSKQDDQQQPEEQEEQQEEQPKPEEQPEQEEAPKEKPEESEEAPVTKADLSAALEQINSLFAEVKQREAKVEAREKAVDAGHVAHELDSGKAELEVEPMTREQLAEKIRKMYFEATILRDEEGKPVMREYNRENKKGDPILDPTTGDPLTEKRVVILRPPLSYEQIAHELAPYHISVSDVVRVIEGPDSDNYKRYKKLENPSDPDGAVDSRFLTNRHAEAADAAGE